MLMRIPKLKTIDAFSVPKKFNAVEASGEFGFPPVTLYS